MAVTTSLAARDATVSARAASGASWVPRTRVAGGGARGGTDGGLAGAAPVGDTAGASAPARLVRDVCDWFRARGVTDVSEFSSAFEDVVFRLPVELRRAQRSSAAA